MAEMMVEIAGVLVGVAIVLVPLAVGFALGWRESRRYHAARASDAPASPSAPPLPNEHSWMRQHLDAEWNRTKAPLQG